jgi:hypothetical protein
MTACKVELEKYLEDTKSLTSKDDPLAWWRNHMSRFPVLAVLARKWLSCVATSAPSERAFSTGGNVVTARRCSLTPSNVRDAVFLAENLYFEERMKKKKAERALKNELKKARQHEQKPPEEFPRHETQTPMTGRSVYQSRQV